MSMSTYSQRKMLLTYNSVGVPGASAAAKIAASNAFEAALELALVDMNVTITDKPGPAGFDFTGDRTIELAPNVLGPANEFGRFTQSARTVMEAQLATAGITVYTVQEF